MRSEIEEVARVHQALFGAPLAPVGLDAGHTRLVLVFESSEGTRSLVLSGRQNGTFKVFDPAHRLPSQMTEAEVRALVERGAVLLGEVR